ncbi:MAG: hypothetical protein PPP56_10305 [Longimonas sp.]|uniref:hypothetical protein n=1 Tax=Longimonas sp. TaxID=2039626 RepID=UPI003357794A
MLIHTRSLLAVGLLLLAASFSLTSCDLFGSDDGSAVDVGVVDWKAEPASVETPASSKLNLETFEPLTAPDTVQAEVSFEVTARTVAPVGCFTTEREDVEQESNTIAITPYDRDPRGPGDACTDNVITLPRTLDLQFDTPGDALIRLNGQRVIGNDFSNRDDTVIEHEVTVVE